jgi:hypothetical protein
MTWVERSFTAVAIRGQEKLLRTMLTQEARTIERLISEAANNLDAITQTTATE